MQRLKEALEALDETISKLEDRIGIDTSMRLDEAKKQAEIVKQIRSREAQTLAVAQKIALRLDQAIDHVEQILKD